MRFKIVLCMLPVLLGVGACGIDTGDPHGEGADAVETPGDAPLEPTSTAEPDNSAEPSRHPPEQTDEPTTAPAVPTSEPTDRGDEATDEPADPTGAPSQDPEAAGSGPVGTYANPLPAGTTFVLSDRIDGEGEPIELWEIALGPTNLDATDEVLAENQFNEIADGRRAVMTEVSATYVGPETGQAWIDLSLAYLGNDGNTFQYGSNDSCGVIPDDLADHGEQFPGATVTGNLCQAVPEGVIEDGMWIVALAFTWDDHRVFVRTD